MHRPYAVPTETLANLRVPVCVCAANIVTHLGACCVFTLLGLSRTWPLAPWLYNLSVASLAACMLNSVLYHTFMNVTAHYKTWLLVRRAAREARRGERHHPQQRSSDVSQRVEPEGTSLVQLDVLGIFGCFFVCEVAIVWFGFSCLPHLRIPCILVYYPVALLAVYKVPTPT